MVEEMLFVDKKFDEGDGEIHSVLAMERIERIPNGVKEVALKEVGATGEMIGGGVRGGVTGWGFG